MREGKARTPPVDVETLPDDLREVLEEQRKLRGAPLYPYLFYARNPAFFRAAQGMWPALHQNPNPGPGPPRPRPTRPAPCGNAAGFCQNPKPPGAASPAIPPGKSRG